MDTYPSLTFWTAAQEALQNAGNLDELFEDTNECSKNRLWRIQETELQERGEPPATCAGALRIYATSVAMGKSGSRIAAR